MPPTTPAFKRLHPEARRPANGYDVFRPGRRASIAPVVPGVIRLERGTGDVFDVADADQHERQKARRCNETERLMTDQKGHEPSRPEDGCQREECMSDLDQGISPLLGFLSGATEPPVAVPNR